MYEVTLIYADGSKWFAGGFEDSDAAWAWIDAEKLKPYWVASTQTQVVEVVIPPPPINAKIPDPIPIILPDDFF